MAGFSILGGSDSEPPDDDSMKQMRELLGPTAVDDAVSHAIRTCWMCLPTEKRTVEEVGRQLHRILDRSLANAKDDEGIFGSPDED